MSKRPRRRKAKPSGRKRRTDRRTPKPPPAGAPDLVAGVTAALDDEPLALLELVSTLLAAFDRRGRSPFEPEAPAQLPTVEELTQTFLGVELTETSALLVVIAELTGDEMLRRRARREVVDRAHSLPGWLAELYRAGPAPRAIEVAHVLRDGDNVMVGARLPDGHELTAVVYIDHNMGTLVKDAFVVPAAAPEMADRMLAVTDDPDTHARDLDPADARARITEAIELGAISFPPFESDTWPACRPLVEWIVGMLPDGGRGHERPRWDDAALAALTARFLHSGSGAGFDDADHGSLLESLLWFGTDYGPGDPLRWSPTAVEILLADWIPRKIVAEAGFLAKAPDLLRAFVRFCHHERGLRAELTEQTLAAVDELEPAYQKVIRSPRPQGPAALLAAMGALAPDGSWPQPDPEPADYREIMLDALRRAVGGADALDRLDTTPLPDEPFDWDAVPADVHERVGQVLALVDGCCGELLDVEHRTACRRLLARAAAGDPEIFRRRGRAATAAAAVCWVIGKANTLFDGRAGPYRLRVKDVAEHLDIGQNSVSGRTEPLLRAVGVNPRQYGAMNLGSPEYLAAHRRASILALRDRYLSLEA